MSAFTWKATPVRSEPVWKRKWWSFWKRSLVGYKFPFDMVILQDNAVVERKTFDDTEAGKEAATTWLRAKLVRLGVLDPPPQEATPHQPSVQAWIKRDLQQ